MSTHIAPVVSVPPIRAFSLQFWLLLGLFVLELPGDVVPFVTYMNKASPLVAVVFGWELGYLWVGLPFFVGLLVSAGLLRSLVPLRWTRIDLIVGYLGAIAGLGSTAVCVVWGIVEYASADTAWASGLVILAITFLLLIAAVTFIIFNWRRRVPQSMLVQMALRAAYIPNAVMCFLVFGLSDLVVERNIGYWLSGYVVVIYAAVLCLFSVSWRKKWGASNSDGKCPASSPQPLHAAC